MNSRVKTLLRPVFFGQCGSWGCRSRVSVSAVAGLDLGKLPTKVHRTVARAGFALKCQKNEGRDALLCGFATGCGKMHRHGCTQESISDAATLLLCKIAAGGCETQCNNCVRGRVSA